MLNKLNKWIFPLASAVLISKNYYINKEPQNFWFLFGSKKKKKKKKNAFDDDTSSGGVNIKAALAYESRRKLLFNHSKYQAGLNGNRPRMRLLTDFEIIQIATLVNELIDLEFFDEESEQRLFEDCVKKIVDLLEDVLPFDFFQLVHSEHNLGGIEEDHALAIEERIVPYVNSLLSFPFLDKSDESRVIHFVVKIVVEAMRHDADLTKLYNRKHAGKLIVTVLMKGAISKIYDKEERHQLVEDALNRWTSLFPFLPSSTLEYIANLMIDWCALHLEEALLTSYHEFLAEHVIKRASEGVIDEKANQEDYRLMLISHVTKNLIQDVGMKYADRFDVIVEYKHKMCEQAAIFIVDNAVDIEKISNVFDFQSIIEN